MHGGFVPHHVFAGAPSLRSQAHLGARAGTPPILQWSCDATPEKALPARRSCQPQSSSPELREEFVDAVGGFGIAKPAVGEWNARPGAKMPEHLLADCLADQLRLRDPGVAGHAS